MKELDKRGNYALFPDQFLRYNRPNIHAKPACRSKKRLTNQEFMPSDYYTSYIPFITATPKEDFIPVGNTNRQQIGGRKLLPTSRIVLYIAETMKNRTIPFVLVWFCFMLFNLSTAWAQSAETRAAEGQTEIKPLQIGDTIPEELWNMPLQVVNHTEGKNTITLNDYRGSTLLLDFLSTGCKSCIGDLPRLSKLEVETDHSVKILPVTTDKVERVEKFWSQNDSTSKADMEVVIIKKEITRYFPHRYISHIVWIDMHGVVCAFTNSNHIQPRTIQAFADGNHTDWPVKTESTSFFQETLLYQNPEMMRLKNNRQRPYSYVAVTSFTEGVSPYVEITADGSRKGKIISYRNRSILDLYLIATDLLYKLQPEQVILQVESPENYDLRRADFTDITRDEWYQKNAVCYEQYVSADISDVEYKKQMLQNLNNLLGLKGTVEDRDGKPFLIIAEKGNN